MALKILTLILSTIIFFAVLELIRREKLTVKYAFAWLVVSVLSIVLVVFDRLLSKLAHILGFELASNFIFFALLAVFVFLSLLMTIFLCQQNSHNDIMAQKLGVLEFEIEQLKKNKNKSV